MFKHIYVPVDNSDYSNRAVELAVEIGRAFGLDLADLADLARKATSQEPLAVGHNIGGNQLRHADAVRFDPGGARARPPLPRWLEVISFLLCGPLMWRYGYRLGGGAPRPARTDAVLSE